MVEPARTNAQVDQLRREKELILNSAGEGIYHLDLNGNFVFINPKAADLIGQEPEELIGQPAHSTIHYKHSDGRDFEIEECPIYASMRDGAQRRISNDVFWRKDGTPLRVDYIAAPLRDNEGKVRGTIVTFRDASIQQLSDARVKLQAEQYRLLFETNPSPMWVFEVKTLQILAVNEAAIAHYGYSRAEFLDLTIADLRAVEDAPALIAALSGENASAHFSGEFRHRRKDGSFVLVQVYSGPIVWEGTAARIVTAIDITEQKRAEEALRETNERLKKVLEVETVGVMFWDLKSGTLVDANNTFLNLMGYSRDDVEAGQLTWQRLTPPEFVEASLAEIRKFQTTGRVGPYEKEYLRKDGSRQWFVFAGSALGENSCVEFCVDITARKAAEKELRTSQAQLRTVFENLGEGIVISDLKGNLLEWNRAALDLHGYKDEDRRHLTELADTFSLAELNGNALAVDDWPLARILRGETLHELELRVKNLKAGWERIFSYGGTIVRDPENEPLMAIVTIRDVTERKEAELQVRERSTVVVAKIKADHAVRGLKRPKPARSRK